MYNQFGDVLVAFSRVVLLELYSCRLTFWLLCMVNSRPEGRPSILRVAEPYAQQGLHGLGAEAAGQGGQPAGRAPVSRLAPGIKDLASGSIMRPSKSLPSPA